jgi:chromosome segregation ATPase
LAELLEQLGVVLYNHDREHDKSTDILQSLRRKEEKLAGERDSAVNKANALEEESAYLRVQLDRAHQRHRDSATSLEQKFSDAIGRKESQVSKLQGELDQCRKENGRFRDDLTCRDNHSAILKSEIAAKDKIVRSLEADIQSHDQTQQRLQQDLHAAKQTIQQLSRDKASSESKMLNLVDSHTDDMQSLMERIVLLEGQLKDKATNAHQNAGFVKRDAPKIDVATQVAMDEMKIHFFRSQLRRAGEELQIHRDRCQFLERELARSHGSKKPLTERPGAGIEVKSTELCWSQGDGGMTWRFILLEHARDFYKISAKRVGLARGSQEARNRNP